MFRRDRDEDSFRRSQTGNGTNLRRRHARTGGGSVYSVRRMRVHDRGQVYYESVWSILPRAVSKVRDMCVEARPVVFCVERETVLPPGLRQVSGKIKDYFYIQQAVFGKLKTNLNYLSYGTAMK